MYKLTTKTYNTALGESYNANGDRIMQEENDEDIENKEKESNEVALPMEETEVYSDLGESMFEDENIYLEEGGEEEQQLYPEEEMISEGIETEEQEMILDYIDVQFLIVLSNEEVKALCEKYTQYVDETVCIILQDTILYR